MERSFAREDGTSKALPRRGQHLNATFWRRFARLGATRGPEWFVRWTPPAIGLVACALAPRERRAVVENLRRVRGERGALRDVLDVAATFATYASCLAEILGAGSPRGRLPRAVVYGELNVLDAAAEGRGVIFATAHTAGWETVGPLLSRDHGLRVMIAEAAEANPGTRAIQDEARRTHGLLVAHVGDDPLSALPLVRHLRDGGVVALQIDRLPAGMRGRRVTLFGRPAAVPEGPLRLAMLTGAPVVPVFAARTGYRQYAVVAGAAVRLSRGAADAELDAAAQAVASAMQAFLQRHPTQWFHFAQST
jgi:lauroyl/myristoyl acyltransferase